MTPVQALSFDVTGTLLGPRIGPVYAEVFGRHGMPVEVPRVEAMVRDVWVELSCRVRLGEDRFSSHADGTKGFWREFVARLAARLELPPPTPFVAAELYDRFARPEAWIVFPEVASTLQALATQRLPLAVVSNFDERLPRLLAATGLAERFSTVVFSAQVGVEKPHPAIFEELLHRLALPAAKVLHVGDSRRDDVEGAQAVGMQALHIDRRGHGDLASLAPLPRLVCA